MMRKTVGRKSRWAVPPSKMRKINCLGPPVQIATTFSIHRSGFQSLSFNLPGVMKYTNTMHFLRIFFIDIMNIIILNLYTCMILLHYLAGIRKE